MSKIAESMPTESEWRKLNLCEVEDCLHPRILGHRAYHASTIEEWRSIATDALALLVRPQGQGGRWLPHTETTDILLAVEEGRMGVLSAEDALHELLNPQEPSESDDV